MGRSNPFAIVQELSAKWDRPFRRQPYLLVYDVLSSAISDQIVHHLVEDGVTSVVVYHVGTVVGALLGALVGSGLDAAGVGWHWEWSWLRGLLVHLRIWVCWQLHRHD